MNDSDAVPQASLAVGVVNEGVAGHSTVDGPGKVEMTGTELSWTVIACDAVAVLPQASLATKVLVIV